MDSWNMALSGISGAKTLIEAFITTRDQTKLLETKLQLLQQIDAVRAAASALRDQVETLTQKNAELEKENRLLQKKQTQLHGYEQFQVVPGLVVYATQPDDGSIPQPPYLCQACYEKGNNSPLNYQAATGPANPAALQCPEHRGHRFQLPRGYKLHHLGTKWG